MLIFRGTHWTRYGPLYLVGIAVPLVMADLTRHVLQGTISCCNSACYTFQVLHTCNLRISFHQTLLRVLFQGMHAVHADSGIWSGPSSSMYRPHCGHSERRLGGLTCLSLTGWLFTIIFTYVGFACMITGNSLPEQTTLACTTCLGHCRCIPWGNISPVLPLVFANVCSRTLCT